MSEEPRKARSYGRILVGELFRRKADDEGKQPSELFMDTYSHQTGKLETHSVFNQDLAHQLYNADVHAACAVEMAWMETPTCYLLDPASLQLETSSVIWDERVILRESFLVEMMGEMPLPPAVLVADSMRNAAAALLETAEKCGITDQILVRRLDDRDLDIYLCQIEGSKNVAAEAILARSKAAAAAIYRNGRMSRHANLVVTKIAKGPLFELARQDRETTFGVAELLDDKEPESLSEAIDNATKETEA